MEGTKQYRFADNPKEKEFHDKFIEMFTHDSHGITTLSMIVIGDSEQNPNYPKRYLTKEEETICVNLIQWLGSPVGQGFLNECGYIKKD